MQSNTFSSLLLCICWIFVLQVNKYLRNIFCCKLNEHLSFNHFGNDWSFEHVRYIYHYACSNECDLVTGNNSCTNDCKHRPTLNSRIFIWCPICLLITREMSEPTNNKEIFIRNVSKKSWKKCFLDTVWMLLVSQTHNSMLPVA